MENEPTPAQKSSPTKSLAWGIGRTLSKQCRVISHFLTLRVPGLKGWEQNRGPWGPLGLCLLSQGPPDMSTGDQGP